jgi:GNAT superfamily N-acetyltransferase
MITQDEPKIRKARPGDEDGIHQAHMRSIREICIKDHGEAEVLGWGNRPLEDRWIRQIAEETVWVIEYKHIIHGVGYIRIFVSDSEPQAHLHALYITPEVLGRGLGKQLAKLMIQAARDAGAQSISLDSSLTAHNFYRQLGFEDSGPIQTRMINGSSVRSYPMHMHMKKDV